MLSGYICDPDVIPDLCGLVCGRLHPELSLGPCADNVIIPLDLTQLYCPGLTLATGPPSRFTTDIVSCWGEPCGEPPISLDSHTVSLVQWVNPLLSVMRDPGSIPRGVLMWNRDSPVSVVSLHNTTIHHPAYKSLPFSPESQEIKESILHTDIMRALPKKVWTPPIINHWCKQAVGVW